LPRNNQLTEYTDQAYSSWLSRIKSRDYKIRLTSRKRRWRIHLCLLSISSLPPFPSFSLHSSTLCCTLPSFYFGSSLTADSRAARKSVFIYGIETPPFCIFIILLQSLEPDFVCTICGWSRTLSPYLSSHCDSFLFKRKERIKRRSRDGQRSCTRAMFYFFCLIFLMSILFLELKTSYARLPKMLAEINNVKRILLIHLRVFIYNIWIQILCILN